jgi:hypothetical protein
VSDARDHRADNECEVLSLICGSRVRITARCALMPTQTRPDAYPNEIRCSGAANVRSLRPKLRPHNIVMEWAGARRETRSPNIPSLIFPIEAAGTSTAFVEHVRRWNCSRILSPGLPEFKTARITAFGLFAPAFSAARPELGAKRSRRIFLP